MNGNVAETIQICAVFGSALGAAIAVMVYRLNMARIQSSAPAGGAQQSEAIEALRREVADLRETTTRYDMSFDTALQRIEARVGEVETKVRQIEAPAEVLAQQRVSSDR